MPITGPHLRPRNGTQWTAVRPLLVLLTFVVGCPAPGVSVQDAGSDGGSLPPDASTSQQPDASTRLNDAGPTAGDATTADAAVVDAAIPDAGAPDASTAPRPILFVHGINGSDADWTVMIDRFLADGVPAERIMARTFENPGWGCNVDNAETLRLWAAELMMTTGALQIDVVAHSMGTLSSRHYVKMLGGLTSVENYVTIAGMNHGLTLPCLSPLNVCVWKELCATGEFITALNAPPATPPPTHWVAIYSDGDDTVPVDSAPLDGADNIMIPGLEHDGPMGVQQSELVYQAVKNALR